MRVRAHRPDPDIPFPAYATPGAVAFDLWAREETIVESHAVGLIPANLIIEVPDGYALLVTLRSGIPRKKGLHMPHGIGVIDRDYCGEHDEVKIQVYNATDQPVTVERGERIAQGLLVQVGRVESWEETHTLGATRGGFGSTGTGAISTDGQAGGSAC